MSIFLSLKNDIKILWPIKTYEKGKLDFKRLLLEHTTSERGSETTHLRVDLHFLCMSLDETFLVYSLIKEK